MINPNNQYQMGYVDGLAAGESDGLQKGYTEGYAQARDAVGLSVSDALPRYHHWVVHYKASYSTTLWDEVTLTIGSGDVTFRVRRSEDAASEVPGVVDVVYQYVTDNVVQSATNAVTALYHAVVARVATDGALMGADDECAIRNLGTMGLLITRKASGALTGTPTCSTLSQRLLVIEQAAADAIDPLAEYYRNPDFTVTFFTGAYIDLEAAREAQELSGSVRGLEILFWDTVHFSDDFSYAYLYCDDGSVAQVDLYDVTNVETVATEVAAANAVIVAPPGKSLLAVVLGVNGGASKMEARLIAAGF